MFANFSYLCRKQTWKKKREWTEADIDTALSVDVNSGEMIGRTDESGSQEVKASTELQRALTQKALAEEKFIGSPQSDKFRTEASLAEARRLEALAEVERLKIARLQLDADVKRTDAERDERLANAHLT